MRIPCVSKKTKFTNCAVAADNYCRVVKLLTFVAFRPILNIRNNNNTIIQLF